MAKRATEPNSKRKSGEPERNAPRRLTPKGEATRARIIEHAADLFAEEGYARASIRDLAFRTGLSSGAIYGTFRGKADLLAAVVDATIASDVEALPLAVMQQTLPDIDAYQYEHPAQRERLRGLLLDAAVAARTEPEVREQLHDAMEPHLDMATEAHDEWRDRAGVDPDLDMRALVLLIWSADLGLAVLDAMGVDLPDPKVWSELVHHMLKSMEAPDARPGAPSPRPPRRSARR
jgi:AcrR family transcriptional regulator